ncbi:uncharacterized protein AC631_03325 [Debaryomyces fabryi]|uniref:4-hydroxybenzoate polyprenyltransferase, mitochondrial n=1 Tax=Debaryomyces fabryi TaxID=58627 RepID=A0A0V1PY60_9ASCO|nr:uncharacterized protein AC631_03325 [Debaryomyces fabryi]KSA00895.1 hypothetical protein AC631_03325 [Debaryomyces fabryi]CUM51772.1 unnamed protein product [Debaryomyces fabryi]
MISGRILWQYAAFNRSFAFSRFTKTKPVITLLAHSKCFSTSIIKRSTFDEQPIVHSGNKPQKPSVDLGNEPKDPRSRFTPEELEASRLARLAGLGWVANLPEKWIPYAELMRIEKPVGALLLLLPSFWGITMAAYSVAAPLTTTLSAITLFTIGAFVMRGAGCTINDIWDRNLDNQVARTIERPIASRRVSVPQAVGWLAVQCFAGLAVLLSLPFECFYLGALSLPFVAAYPLFKRFTYYPQVMLSICYSWGCLLGFPAVQAPLLLSVAVPLFLSNFVWCMTYDTIYAHQDKAFDVHAGIKSTALAWGDKTKPILNSLSAAQVGLFTTAGIMNGMGPGFYVFGAWAFLRLFRQIRNVNLDDPSSCWKAFTSNINTGYVFWFGMVIDYILLLLGYL